MQTPVAGHISLGVSTRHLICPRHSTVSVTRIKRASEFPEGDAPPLISPPVFAAKVGFLPEPLAKGRYKLW